MSNFLGISLGIVVMTGGSPVFADSMPSAEAPFQGAAAVDAQPVDPAAYIGIRHIGDDVSDFPGEALVSRGGWLVYPAGSNQFSDYGIGIYHRGHEMVVLLEKMAGRSGRSPVWDVVDAMVVEEPFQDYFLHPSCSMDGKPWNGEIFAYMSTDPDEEYTTDLLAAWQVNLDTETIESIATTGITCVNPGYGV